MQNISFKRHRFPSEVIRHAVWLYAQFSLSYRDVEDLLAERGLDISYETVRRWFLKFGGPIARNRRRMIRAANETQGLGQSSHGCAVDRCLVHSSSPRDGSPKGIAPLTGSTWFVSDNIP